MVDHRDLTDSPVFSRRVVGQDTILALLQLCHTKSLCWFMQTILSFGYSHVRELADERLGAADSSSRMPSTYVRLRPRGLMILESNHESL
jgi:hypothetical protein